MRDLFERCSQRLLQRYPDDERGRMLSAPALKVAGSAYAFVTADAVTVKLPEARVTELIASGAGDPCDPAGGRPMRQWVRLVPVDEEACLTYLLEARTFVAGQSRS